eukprot:1146217-Pelagomonas_calceolata.AAC.3
MACRHSFLLPAVVEDWLLSNQSSAGSASARAPASEVNWHLGLAHLERAILARNHEVYTLLGLPLRGWLLGWVEAGMFFFTSLHLARGMGCGIPVSQLEVSAGLACCCPCRAQGAER